MLALLAVAMAVAAGPIESVSDEYDLVVGGTFARAFPDPDGGWNLLWGAGGGFNLLPMPDDYAVEDYGRRELTGMDELVDHGIARCPDGSFLHVASSGLDQPDDSAYAFRYDAGFSLLASAAIEERAPERRHNDPAVLCAPLLQGVAFGGQAGTSFFRIAGDATVAEVLPMDQVPSMEGGSMFYDRERDLVFALNTGFGNTLSIVAFTQELEPVQSWELEVLPAGLRAWWPQGARRVGDYYLVAHMGRDDAAGFDGDTGDLYLQVFDLDWRLLDTVQVSHDTPPSGGMRPWLAIRGDTLLALYDREVRARLFEIRLSISTGDSGPVPDTGGGGGSGAAAGGCGCGSAPGPGGLAGLLPALALLAVARARRSA